VTTKATRFGPFRLGPSAPLLIVAEIGVNHDGSRDTGLRQVRAAVAAGAQAVKFQTFRADELATRGAPTARYQRRAETTDQLAMLRRLEMRPEDFAAYRQEAARLGAMAFSTPFDAGSAAELASVGVELMKIPSGELTNHDLVAAVARTRLPTLMSTGMATDAEVAAAVATFRRARGGPLALLHCVSSYPAPLEEQNLLAIPALRRRFGVPVGLSDHTLGRDAAVAAVALGADVIEKHFTIDRSLAGPDHAMSMEPADFADMVGVLGRVRRGLGSGAKMPTPSEAETKGVARRSVVAARDLAAGHVLARSDLTIKRPGTGLAAAEIDHLVGRRLARDLAADELLRADDVSSGRARSPSRPTRPTVRGTRSR
jgi:N,N'-diacetyllegionaminate synthase